MTSHMHAWSGRAEAALPPSTLSWMLSGKAVSSQAFTITTMQVMPGWWGHGQAWPGRDGHTALGCTLVHKPG